MRISDWSSDVCSSDLFDIVEAADGVDARGQPWNERRHIVAESRDPARLDRRETALFDDFRALPIIAARERDRKSVGEGKSVSVSVVPGGPRHLNKKTYLTLVRSGYYLNQIHIT